MKKDNLINDPLLKGFDPEADLLKTADDFEKITLGHKIYSVRDGRITQYRYAGFSPVQFEGRREYIILIHGGNVSTAETRYLPHLQNYGSEIFTENYETAKKLMLYQELTRIHSIRKIYFKEEA